jgi:hypothetical protein
MNTKTRSLPCNVLKVVYAGHRDVKAQSAAFKSNSFLENGTIGEFVT